MTDMIIETPAPEVPLFDRIEEFVMANGVPITRDQMIEKASSFYGNDLSASFERVLGSGSNVDFSFENRARINNWSDRYRVSHSITTQLIAENNETYADNSMMYVGRGVGRRAHRSYWAQFIGLGNMITGLNRAFERGAYTPTVPILFSEQRSFEVPSFEEDDPDFIFIQIMCSDALRAAVAGSHGYLHHGTDATLDASHNIEMSQPEDLISALEPDVNRLRAEGWQIITETAHWYDYSIGQRYNEDGSIAIIEIPVAALPPADSDLAGRCAVRLFTYQSRPIEVIAMTRLLNMMPELNVDQEEIEGSEIITLFNQIYSAALALNAEVEMLSSSITSNMREVENFSNSAATYLRRIDDDSRRMESISMALPQQSLSYVKSMAQLPEQMSALRQIKSFDINVENNKTLIKFVTHYFGMRAVISRNNPNMLCEECNSDRCMHITSNIRNVLIPQMEFSIDTSRDSFNGSVSVKNAINARNKLFHPHVNESSGNICWGNAAMGLAEAWGRRDWESFIRLILGWATIYNDHSPYNTPARLAEANGEPPRTGWITDEDEMRDYLAGIATSQVTS